MTLNRLRSKIKKTFGVQGLSMCFNDNGIDRNTGIDIMGHCSYCGTDLFDENYCSCMQVMGERI